MKSLLLFSQLNPQGCRSSFFLVFAFASLPLCFVASLSRCLFASLHLCLLPFSFCLLPFSFSPFLFSFSPFRFFLLFSCFHFYTILPCLSFVFHFFPVSLCPCFVTRFFHFSSFHVSVLHSRIPSRTQVHNFWHPIFAFLAFLAFSKRQRLSRRGRTFFRIRTLGRCQAEIKQSVGSARECCLKYSHWNASPLALAFAAHPVLALHQALARPLLFFLLPLLAIHVALTLCLTS